MSVTPHSVAAEMKYRRPRSDEMGARVQWFLRNEGSSSIKFDSKFPVTFSEQSPDALVGLGIWAWHDFPSARTNETLELPPGGMTVWQFNSASTSWGANSKQLVEIPGLPREVVLANPQAWISSATFLGQTVFPDHLVLHVENASGSDLTLVRLRLWLPAGSGRALLATGWRKDFEAFPKDRSVPTGEKGGLVLRSGRLPLGYCAIELETSDATGSVRTLWSYLRIKREVFDISGGWTSGKFKGREALTMEPYLKTLRRMHINTAHIGEVAGYTDNSDLYARYPLKRFHALQPLERFDTDALLPWIHAVEFLGEPQYGGGQPVAPMKVWRQLLPYETNRLPTSLTHSEERIWRFYAGLSDYPHFDAYRVNAPAPDNWMAYDRWGGQKLRWGAPLETIGVMTRSLRELNRPSPVAYWSQGAHDGWESYGGRERTSPNPDELRSQAYHALASRITSLYWFNLSLPSLIKFPDLIEPINRVNREVRLMQSMLLGGDAYEFRKEMLQGEPDWEIASVTGPEGGVFFALDAAYRPDPVRKEFVFGPPRDAEFRFRLPRYLERPAEVFRLSADGVHDCDHSIMGGRLIVRDRATVAGVYVAAAKPGWKDRLKERHAGLIAEETRHAFDPGGKPEDLKILRSLVE